MDLIVVELKQTKKKLETKGAEMSKVEQAAYDVGIIKIAESLTVQLKNVALAFCLEVWGQALNATGVSTESKLRASNKVYYPPALHLAPTPPQPLANPSSAPPSSSNWPASTPSSTLAKGKEKEKELPPPAEVLDVELKETAEVP